MKSFGCPNCGSTKYVDVDGKRICAYCGTRVVNEKESHIKLDDDVEILLEKCRKDPKNAKKYANLILDIDPTNEEVKKYL